MLAITLAENLQELTFQVKLHTLISVIGIASGFIVMFGLLASSRLPILTAVFLTTTILTSVSGFFLPAEHFLPSHAVGILSLIILPIAVYALYKGKLVGKWRWIYVITAMFSQYLNVFVLVVQSYLRVPALHDLDPTIPPSGNPFKITQLVVLLIFIAWTIVATKKFHPRGSL